MGELAEHIHKEAQKVLSEVIDIRRDLHSNPELSFMEIRTSNKVAEILERIGLEVKRDIATTGVVGLLRGAKDGPTIALRADMDALPINEGTGLPYASTNPGVMHACGHDGHVAMLLGAAMILAGMRERIRGNVKFIFQPGEEGYAGARKMIEDGVLDDEPRIEAAFALHIDPLGDPGSMAVREGPMMASADMFLLSIIGKGGHGAMPNATIDPILVSGHLITSLQGIASRQASPMDSVVLSICRIRGGEGLTTIPDQVEMGGTVRLLSPELRERMPSMMERIIKGVTSAFGADYSFNYIYGYPVTVNDSDFTQLARSAAASVLGGDDKIRLLGRPRMPSEDFSYFLEKVPGTFAMLGARPEDVKPAPPHSERYNILESALEDGVKVHVAVALKYLGEEI